MGLKHSFARRLVGTLVITMILTILTYTGSAYYVIQTRITQQMENDGRLLTNAMKREIEKYDITSLTEIQQIFNEMKGISDGDIAYISLSDMNGTLLVTDEEVFGSTDATSSASSQADTSSTSSDSDVIVEHGDSGEQVFNISEPLSGNKGVLNVGLSMVGVNTQIKSAVEMLIIIGLILAIIVLISSIIISKILVKTLKKTMTNLGELSQGDLTVSFDAKTKDEFGKLDLALNQFTEILRDSVMRTKTAISEFDHIANALTASKNDIVKSTNLVSEKSEVITNINLTQESHMKEMFLSYENLDEQLNTVKSKVTDVTNHSETIMKASSNGNSHLTGLVKAMEEVTVGFEQGTAEIKLLNENVANITNITHVINEVAEQTNLLALNAAIEAARAGESGRGFAVVAEEIRKLAEQVISSSKGINIAIESMKQTVESVTTRNVQIESKIDNQTRFIGDTVSAFENIQNQVQSTQIQLKELIHAINEMDQNKKQMLDKLDTVDRISNEGRKASEAIYESVLTQHEKVIGFESISDKIVVVSSSLGDTVRGYKV